MERNVDVSRGEGWEKRKADFAGDKAVYGKAMGWVVPLQDKVYRILLNNGNNRFAKKHLIFPGENDAAKLLEGVGQNRDYLDGKAIGRLKKRDVVIQDARHSEKFKTNSVVGANSAVNMKPLKVAQGAPARHIDQKAAAVKFAEALALKNLVANEEFVMEVDFGCQCVVTAYYVGKAKAESRAKWGSKLSVRGRVAAMLEADRPAVELFHAET